MDSKTEKHVGLDLQGIGTGRFIILEHGLKCELYLHLEKVQSVTDPLQSSSWKPSSASTGAAGILRAAVKYVLITLATWTPGRIELVKLSASKCPLGPRTSMFRAKSTGVRPSAFFVIKRFIKISLLFFALACCSTSSAHFALPPQAAE